MLVASTSSSLLLNYLVSVPRGGGEIVEVFGKLFFCKTLNRVAAKIVPKNIRLSTLDRARNAAWRDFGLARKTPVALRASGLLSERAGILSGWQGFRLAPLQWTVGILPVSSVCEGVIPPRFLGGHVDQESPTFLPLFVAYASTAVLMSSRRRDMKMLGPFGYCYVGTGIAAIFHLLVG